MSDDVAALIGKNYAIFLRWVQSLNPTEEEVVAGMRIGCAEIEQAPLEEILEEGRDMLEKYTQSVHDKNKLH